MQPLTPPSCESANLGESLPSSCAISLVVPILKRAFGAVSPDPAVEWACWGLGGLTVDDVERFAKELEPLLVACWSLVETCWVGLGLPSAMPPVAAAPSFLLLPLLLSFEQLPNPTSTNAPERQSVTNCSKNGKAQKMS